ATLFSLQAQREDANVGHAHSSLSPACGPPTSLFPLISQPGCSWTYVKVEE
ncbi:hypothetical protein KUCAC02_027794, partial [Chaenocephalus aceratus]